jgi:hypothetical protein
MACVQQVVVTYDENKKPLTYELQCTGKCDDGTDCKPKAVADKPDKKGDVTREFCACKEDESEKCHIVLYTVTKKGKPKEIVEQYFKCEHAKKQKCPDKTTCAAIVVGRDPFPGDKDNDDDRYQKLYFECGCWSEDEVWRGK